MKGCRYATPKQKDIPVAGLFSSSDHRVIFRENL